MSNTSPVRRVGQVASRIAVLAVIALAFLGVPLLVAQFAWPILWGSGSLETLVRWLVVGSLAFGLFGFVTVIRELRRP